MCRCGPLTVLTQVNPDFKVVTFTNEHCSSAYVKSCLA